MIYTLIFPLCVCPTVVVEWSKALVHPGSQLATSKIIFFFFLSFPNYFGLFEFVLPLCVDLASF